MNLSNKPEHVTFTIGATELEILELTGEERLSTLFRFELLCAIKGPPPSIAELIGQDAEITLRDGYQHERRINGLVAAARVTVSDNDKAELVVEVRPHAFART